MLTVHTNYEFGGYSDDRADLLKRLENPTLKRNPTLASQLKPHFDGKDSLAMGYGVDLLANSNAELLRLFSAAGLSDADMGWSDPTVKTTDLNLLDIYRQTRGGNTKAIWDDRAGKLSLQLPSEPKATDLLNAVAQDREALLDQALASRNITLSESNERLALLSMVYNGGLGVFGQALSQSKLLTALETGNRAEAWFEIRYNTNAESTRTDATSFRVAGGIANRRYAESDLFGLYNGGDGSAATATPDTVEAKDVLRMYTAHKTDIERYEGRFSPVNPDAGTQRNAIGGWIEPAKEYLIANFGEGVTISGNVLVGQDDLGRGDILTGTEEGDLLFGEQGSDVLRGNGGTDVLYGGAGSDTLSGGAEDDVLFGEAGDDTLQGGAGADHLIGGEQDDTLVGGTGDDLLEGGAGFDRYVWNTGDGNDRIEDSDNRGNIVINGQALTGGVKRSDGTTPTYQTLDGAITFEQVGGDLLVHIGDETLTVNENFQSGQLGIKLVDEADYANDLDTRVEVTADPYLCACGRKL